MALKDMNLELGSSPPPPLEQDALPSVGPLEHHLLPPPTTGEQWRVAYIEIARWIRPEYN